MIVRPKPRFVVCLFLKLIIAQVKLQSPFDFTEDLEMDISYAHPESLISYELATSPQGIFSFDCVVANFLPRFTIPHTPDVEVIFVIDRSGSMEGGAIQQARNSLLILLKSLPFGCRFQVVGFGSTFHTLFDA